MGQRTMTVHIRFATEILKRLGEELNPSPDQGIVELVKNAYDADAHQCIVEIDDPTSGEGIVRIVDDGDGMTPTEIENGWLILGRSSKAPTGVTRLGRLPSGSKGLGRLAALRLGKRAILVTRPRTSTQRQFELAIDWGDYEDAQTVDEVPLEIADQPRQIAQSGTAISIIGLRRRMLRVDVQKLARTLVLLADPFGEDPASFTTTLRVPEFADLEALVRSRYFEDAEFHLTARVGVDGRASAEVRDSREQILFAAEHDQLRGSRESLAYGCPPSTFDLWAYLLTKQTFALRTTTLADVRSWLSTVGGVHIYLNGLRVGPYGNPGNDWLEMNLRRAQSPEERPSTNTSIGKVVVEDREQRLTQKTDRSGFIEDHAFLELREFARDALSWMARERLRTAEARRRRERQEATSQALSTRGQMEGAIDSVPEPVKSQVRSAFARYDRARDREASALRSEIQLYRTLSTAGITAATFAHESTGNPLKVIGQSLKAIERRGRRELGDAYESKFAEPVEAVKRSVESLSALSNITLSLIDRDKRRLRRVDVQDVLVSVLKAFEPFVAGRDVEVSKELAQGSPYLRASEAAIESIVTNLLNNSLQAFEKGAAQKRRIQVRTALLNGLMEIRVADNGPGITGIELADIWLPGQTTRPNGTGLGLTIVRDAVSDLGGTVEAKVHGALGGAEMIVSLPIIGA